MPRRVLQASIRSDHRRKADAVWCRQATGTCREWVLPCVSVATITFRRATRADFPLLATWLAQPHVARWWNHDFTSEAVERDFGQAADGAEPSEDYIVVVDERPIGLIQYSRYVDYQEYLDELAPLLVVPEEAVGIDYLIGEPTLVGRGLGTAMLRAFADHIWRSKRDASCIIVAVCSANAASWKALLNAGFRIVARGDLEPDNPIDEPMHEILRLDRPTP